MTREQRLVVGLEDLTALIISCKCGMRLSMSPDKISIPEKCPNGECSAVWGGKPSHQVTTEREEWSAANLDLVDVIKRVRANQAKGTFRVLLEFEEA